MSLEEYMNPTNHIGPCLKLEAICPLGCDQIFKSVNEGQDHYLKCENRLDKCKVCDQYILNKMQGSHDCFFDLKEKLDQVEKWSNNQI